MREKTAKRLISVENVRLANSNLMVEQAMGHKLGAGQQAATSTDPMNVTIADTFLDFSTRRKNLAEAGRQALRTFNQK
ncbi:MAG TPA: hypothetical protein VFW93_07985 [Aquabacterium sp.]|uniref:hypothetical protein n=1 Tax=Aquabacterium sp. TaxID=1872578 RepID=UPI002E3063B8|nr:hypothetical protein [Aquabacterium sp.]HEX5356142.1 hypothetical protein [Aquabacterium sp.]